MSTIGRDGGKIAFEVTGEGPLVLCVPGMGDLRSSFRRVTPILTASGYRVAMMDLRGHGGSSSSFPSYDDEALAGDIVALIEHLGAPAAVLGNSMGAAGAVIAAARRPDLISALVLIGPFVRNRGSKLGSALLQLALLRPWGPAVWCAYFSSLSPTKGPPDRAEHEAEVRASLSRPGRWRAFRRTSHSSHQPAQEALSSVTAPTLIIMGTRDRDFPDPDAEAAWISEALHGSVLMIPDAGHYPMSERAKETVPPIAAFLQRVGHRNA
ncbi:alpha/beta hydrolase [Paenarthrobacter sp. PH39-S1]|uniref:alpha/beta fold hydrolase n=1 Tax=Paenarthrobacter sp. PH39-S1 TaxID=3046204 RepID=UPI0024BBABF7|nr:alpha/beta hydrolase [Paenarthrobacter sp. PH39-S1]MDJ0356706.1 alpha/beta hydrolase [Paenarthrobacter sp. PH39-S1]